MPQPPHVGFVLERSLGHRTHADNLAQLLPSETAIDADLVAIPYEVEGWAAKVPVFNSNWTVRAGLRARRAIKQLQRRRPLDGLFVHTQVPAVLARDWLSRIPSVVSLDATPLQYDELGASYGHVTGNAKVEALKWRANRAAFERARRVVTWSSWAKDGVVSGYGIDPAKITVIPPGVRPGLWHPSGVDRASRAAGDGPVRILFVGGDLERKGGDVLLEAFAALRRDRTGADSAARDLELHLVTGADVPPTPGVVVHHGLTPNSPELVALYHHCDLFCLPTRGDCLPMVLSEAGAAELPLVSTAVAGIPEIVVDGQTGLVVPVDDAVALTRALRTLVDQPELREQLGRAARELVDRDFDAVRNTERLVDLIVEVTEPSVTLGADDAPVRPRHGVGRPGAPVLLTVSGEIDPDVLGQAGRGERPVPDYVELAKAMDADVVDVPEARRRAGRPGRLIERLGGAGSLLAWVCFRERRRYDAVFTDGEQVGLPLAALCRLTRRPAFAHVMVVHLLSVPKKALLHRALRLGRYVDTAVVYSTAQERFLVERLGYQPEQVVFTPFMVDSDFFAPGKAEPQHEPRPMLCSAGLEFRDYPTLLEAVRGLDARVVVAAASPWSKRTDSTEGTDVPDNVEVCRLGFVDLRQLYADADLVVMPLVENDFQAGITTILEAMAMGNAVVCSRTTGQRDVIVDGQSGVYVAPGDPGALRAAVDQLLGDGARAGELGAAAHEQVVAECDLRLYAPRLAKLVSAAIDRHR